MENKYKLYSHQQNIINEDKKWCGLFLGTGSGKSLTALLLAKGNILIVVPKQLKLDKTWERAVERFGLDKNIKVISKEDFKREWKLLPQVDTLIVDEFHTFAGVLPDTKRVNKENVPKTSQLFDSLLKYTRRTPPTRLYLLTATPATKPMHVWAIAKILGHDWRHDDFRTKYYTEVSLGGYRKMFKPRNTPELKNRLIELVKFFGYTGGLSDFFDVPEQTQIVKYVELSTAQKTAMKKLVESEADPMAVRVRQRTIENGVLYGSEVYSDGKEDTVVRKVDYFDNEKIPYIIERAYEFDKLIIFANYKAQIQQIADALKKEGFNVLTMTGETKGRDTIIQEAEEAEKCIIVIQTNISAGYELKSFRTMIFASLSYRVLDRVQAEGRNLRSDHLRNNLYIDIVVKGGLDEACYKSIKSGVDFNELVTKAI